MLCRLGGAPTTRRACAYSPRPYSPAAKKAKKRARAVHPQASTVLPGPPLAFLGPGKKGQDLPRVSLSWGEGDQERSYFGW